MKRVTLMIVAAALSLAVAGLSTTPAAGEDVRKMTKEKLRSMLGKSDVTILDVRVENQWKNSDLKIVGARHENSNEVKSWANKYPKENTIVLY